MNPNAILALISDLYSQVSQLTQEIAGLRKQLAEASGVRKEPPQDDGESQNGQKAHHPNESKPNQEQAHAGHSTVPNPAPETAL